MRQSRLGAAAVDEAPRFGWIRGRGQQGTGGLGGGSALGVGARALESIPGAD